MTGDLASAVGSLPALHVTVVDQGRIHWLGPGRADGLRLVSAAGVVHPMVPVATREGLVARQRVELRRRVAAELRAIEQSAPPHADRLAWFLELAGARAGAVPRRPDDGTEGPELPDPHLPEPSLVVLGRIWLLAPGRAGAGSLHLVRPGGAVLRLTGGWTSVAKVEAAWRAELAARLAKAAERRARRTPAASPPLRAAQRELAETGHVQRGSLLYLPTDPPRIAHLVRAHHNRHLGRQVREGEVAIAATLAHPTAPGLWAIVRNGAQWAGSPVGVCLSRSANRGSFAGGSWEGPLEQVRWAATTVAAKGAWHE